MRMIETIVNITHNHELCLNLPSDIQIGQHKIILIIEEYSTPKTKESSKVRSLGLLDGQLQIPDNFNELYNNEINELFAGKL